MRFIFHILYHGDGKSIGKGHLQLKIASGKLKFDDLPKIFVHPKLLEKHIKICKDEIDMQRALFKKFSDRQISVFPLLYEDFLFDKVNCFRNFLNKLDYTFSDEDIERILSKESFFKKVHPLDITEFVINADELIEKYGHEYIRW